MSSDVAFGVEIELLLAPQVIRETFESQALATAIFKTSHGRMPTAEAATWSLFRTLQHNGGTDADFEWLRSAGLVDEQDRIVWEELKRG